MTSGNEQWFVNLSNQSIFRVQSVAFQIFEIWCLPVFVVLLKHIHYINVVLLLISLSIYMVWAPLDLLCKGGLFLPKI